MVKNIKLLVYPVTDIEKAKTFYSKFLGVEPYADSPYYVGYRVGVWRLDWTPTQKPGLSVIRMSPIFVRVLKK